MLNLNEPHAALDEPPRRQELRAEFAAMRQIEAVELLRFGSFLREVDDFRHRVLHAERQLVRMRSARQARDRGDTRRRAAC